MGQGTVKEAILEAAIASFCRKDESLEMAFQVEEGYGERQERLETKYPTHF